MFKDKFILTYKNESWKILSNISLVLKSFRDQDLKKFHCVCYYDIHHNISLLQGSSLTK